MYELYAGLDMNSFAHWPLWLVVLYTKTRKSKSLFTNFIIFYTLCNYVFT